MQTAVQVVERFRSSDTANPVVPSNGLLFVRSERKGGSYEPLGDSRL